MICRNCGFQNAPGDAFCGSCGQFLEWTGEQPAPTTTGGAPAGPPSGVPADPPTAGPGATPAAPSSLEDTTPTTTPPPPIVPPPKPPGFPRTQAVPMSPSRPSGFAQRAPSAIVCWNCGRSNPASRAFCQQCGEKLVVGGGAAGATATTTTTTESGGASRRTIALIVGAIALLLLAGGAAAFLFSGGGGGSPTPTLIANATATTAPTPTSQASASPTAGSPSTAQPTGGATIAPPTSGPPTVAPATGLPPTIAPGTQPPIATEPDCRAVEYPTQYRTLNGEPFRRRVPEGFGWCVYEILVDRQLGTGRVTVTAAGATWLTLDTADGPLRERYVFPFPDPRKAWDQASIRYGFECYDECHFAVHIGYHQVPFE